MDLLTLAKLDAGTFKFDMHEVPLNDLLANIVDRFAYQPNFRKTRITLDLTEENIVLADGERIIQVFNNLIDNAVKFTGGKGLIEISDLSDPKHAVILVKDDGIGISGDEIERIFDRFYQVDKSRGRNKIRSVGLGLSIANQILRAHAGVLSVTSELGRGSCFMVKIPLAHAKTR